MALAPIWSARACALSTVRLATVTFLGFCAQKCAAHSSIISPAPTNKMLESEMFPKILLATLTAAAAKEIDLVPISVVERTSLATEKVFLEQMVKIQP